MRSVVVCAAAIAIAGIGASSSPKWSGMNSVEYPRSSSLRALSRHADADVAFEICTPNRNGLVMLLLLSGEARDDRRERLGRLDRHDDVRHLPALAPLLERLDDARRLDADERGGASTRVGLRRRRTSPPSPSRIADASSVTCTKPTQRLDLEVVEARRPRRRAATRASGRSPRASATARSRATSPSPERRFALMPTIFASRAASPRIFGAAAADEERQVGCPAPASACRRDR